MRTLAFLVLILQLPSTAPAGELAFETDVAPVLRQNCLRCHAGRQARGGLDLSTRAGLLAGGESGLSAVVPGRPEQSYLLDLVSGDKPEMPKTGEPLTAAQVAALRTWIAEGADWPEALVLKEDRTNWWSLRPLQKPQVPALESSWIRTPVDAFILAKLREHGLSPSPEADRRTLIRRLTYDLHGLPPTPEEVEAFVNDEHPRAWEHLVDRLLASPRYGERWARHWLDVVHYADTHGYDKDKVRPHAWPYRDYVIRSLNADKPYGRFVTEQLAGDVLPSDAAEGEGIVATGFIAAGPWDFVGHVELREGTVDKQTTRVLDRDDMVMNAMSTFASLTVHCARCHDHKFDPITQADYYRLQAVFAGVDRADRLYDSDPQTAERRRALLARRNELKVRETAVAEKVASLANGHVGELERQIAGLQKQASAAGAKDRGQSPTNGYHSAIMPTAEHVKWVQVDLGEERKIDEIRLVPARPTDFPDTPGFGFPVRYKVEVSSDPGFETSTILRDHTAADVPNPGDEPVRITGRGTAARFIRVTAVKLWERSNDFVFALAELQVDSGGGNLAAGAAVSALDSIEAGRWSTRHLTDGYSSRRLLDAADLDPEMIERRIAELQREREQVIDETLDDATRAERRQVQQELAAVETELTSLPPEQLVYAAARHFKPQGSFTPTGGKPRPVHLLHRGSVTSPGEEALPGSVGCVPELSSRFELGDPADEGARRLALAEWLADDRNPLTWRSIVNRVWQYHFGRGVVETPNDFGRMGALPTHPELLDWLALEFRDGGHSLKSLHRLLVTSAVYRQSSAERGAGNGERGTPEAPVSVPRSEFPAPSSIDSGNRLLWRMNRRRLEAEEIRDAVLAVSGALDPRMYGPGFYAFAFEDDHSPRYLYERHDPDAPGSWRRSVYRFIVRSVPDPFMDALDCADPSANVPVRNETVTALQALSLLNHQFMVSQAERFAWRIRGELGAGSSERGTKEDELRRQIERAWEWAVGRRPSDDEAALLLDYTARHGLENLCRTIFNANEFIFVD